MTNLSSLKKELKSLGSVEKAKNSTRFFKTAKGEYGAGDVFIGVTAPEQKKIAMKYKSLSLTDIENLLHSKEHEFRSVALGVLVLKFKSADVAERKKIYSIYIKNTKWINNWDLVDLSASGIVGEYLYTADKTLLFKFAQSKNIWERRIAMIATYAYIKKDESDIAFSIADILIHDEHDLIQKAVGWMLREIGKRCGQEIEENFLRTRYKTMPRTMLRYAIERFPEKKRLQYLKGGVA